IAFRHGCVATESLLSSLNVAIDSSGFGKQTELISTECIQNMTTKHSLAVDGNHFRNADSGIAWLFGRDADIASGSGSESGRATYETLTFLNCISRWRRTVNLARSVANDLRQAISTL